MRFAPISDRAGPVPVPFMEQYASARSVRASACATARLHVGREREVLLEPLHRVIVRMAPLHEVVQLGAVLGVESLTDDLLESPTALEQHPRPELRRPVVG